MKEIGISSNERASGVVSHELCDYLGNFLDLKRSFDVVNKYNGYEKALQEVEREAFQAGFKRGTQEKCDGKH